MTGYLVRRDRDRCVWTGIGDLWSSRESDARVFEFATMAHLFASRDCGDDPDTYAVEPTFVADRSALWPVAA